MISCAVELWMRAVKMIVTIRPIHVANHDLVFRRSRFFLDMNSCHYVKVIFLLHTKKISLALILEST